MCGIAGIWGDIGLQRLKAMADSLRHRGPDDEGYWTGPRDGIGFAHRRLSIIDPAGGRQPIANENGRIVTIDTPDNLKNAIQGTSVVEVIFDSPILTHNQDELAQYGQTKVQDNTARIQVTNVSQTLKGITLFADTYGLEIKEMNTVKPSLEDAFVKLTGVQSEAMLLEKEQRGRGI